jgi:hypothetical protein
MAAFIFEVVPAIVPVGQATSGIVITGTGFLSQIFLELHILDPRAGGQTIVLSSSQFTVTYDNRIDITVPITLNAVATYSIALLGPTSGQVLSGIELVQGTVVTTVALLDAGLIASSSAQDFALSPATVVENTIITGMRIDLLGIPSSSVKRVKFTGPGTFIQDLFQRPTANQIQLNPVTFGFLGAYSLQLFADVGETQQIGPTHTGALTVVAPGTLRMQIDHLTTNLLQPGQLGTGIKAVGSNFTLETITRILLQSDTGNTVSFTPQAAPFNPDSAVPAGKFRLISDVEVDLGDFTINVPGLYGIQFQKTVNSQFVWLASQPLVLTVKDTHKPAVVFTPEPQDFPLTPVQVSMQAQYTDPVTGLPNGVPDNTSTIYYTTVGARPGISPSYAYSSPVLVVIPTVIYAIAVDSVGTVSDAAVGFFNIGGLKARLPLGFEPGFDNFIRADRTDDLIRDCRIKYKAFLNQDTVPGVNLVAQGYTAGDTELLRDIRRAVEDILKAVGLAIHEALAPPILRPINNQTLQVTAGREIFAGTPFPGNIGDASFRVTRRSDVAVSIDSSFADGTYGVYLTPSLVGQSYLDIFVTPTSSPPNRPFLHLAGTFDVVSGFIAANSISNVVDITQRPIRTGWTDPVLDHTTQIPPKDIHWRELEIALQNAELPSNITSVNSDNGTRPTDPPVSPSVGVNPAIPLQVLQPSNTGDPLLSNTVRTLPRGDVPTGPASQALSTTFTVAGQGTNFKTVQVTTQPYDFSIHGQVAGDTVLTIDTNAQTVVPSGGDKGGYCAIAIRRSGGVDYGQVDFSQDDSRSIPPGDPNSVGVVFSGGGKTSVTWTITPVGFPILEQQTWNPPVKTGALYSTQAPSSNAGVHSQLAGGPVECVTSGIQFGLSGQINTANYVCTHYGGSADSGTVLAKNGQELTSRGLVGGTIPPYMVNVNGTPQALDASQVPITMTGGTIRSKAGHTIVAQVSSSAGSGITRTQRTVVKGDSLSGIPDTPYTRTETWRDFRLFTVAFHVPPWTYTVQVPEQQDTTFQQNAPYDPSGPTVQIIEVPLTKTFDTGGKWGIQSTDTRWVVQLETLSGAFYPANSPLLGQDKVVFTNNQGQKVLRVAFSPTAAAIGNVQGVTFTVFVNDSAGPTYSVNENGLVTGGHSPVSIPGPDPTTIKVTATATGLTGTVVNIRSTFTTDGTAPVINPSSAASGYTIGDTQHIYDVVPPRFIVAPGQSTFIRESIRMAIAIENAATPQQDNLSATFQIDFPPAQPAITGWEPSVVIQGVRTKLTIDPTLTQVVTVSGATVTRNYVVQTVNVDDPDSIEVVAKLLGTTNSQGVADIVKRTAAQPASAPTLPSIPTSPDGTLIVGESLELLAATRGYVFRGAFSPRDFYVALRATDQGDQQNVQELFITLTVAPTTTLTALDVLIRRNATLTALEDLATVSGTYGTINLISTVDNDTLEILLQPQGTPGTQVTLREVHQVDGTAFPNFPPNSTNITYDPTTGVQSFTDKSNVIGIFNIDDKISILGPMTASSFRALSPGAALEFKADATSDVDLNNVILRTWRLQSISSPVLTGFTWYFRNSRTNQLVLLTAGADPNHPLNPITGTGTYLDPYVLRMGAPEQLEVFARPTISGGNLAFLQTGYAYDPKLVTELFPGTPSQWGRAFSSADNVLVHPHPVPPGTDGNRPLTASQIILASGGTPIDGTGTNPGVSHKIDLKVVGTAANVADNVVTGEIWLVVKDPSLP